MKCKYCDNECSCHINPPCSTCESHMICDGCGEMFCDDLDEVLCPECREVRQ